MPCHVTTFGLAPPERPLPLRALYVSILELSYSDFGAFLGRQCSINGAARGLAYVVLMCCFSPALKEFASRRPARGAGDSCLRKVSAHCMRRRGVGKLSPWLPSTQSKWHRGLLATPRRQVPRTVHRGVDPPRRPLPLLPRRTGAAAALSRIVPPGLLRGRRAVVRRLGAMTAWPNRPSYHRGSVRVLGGQTHHNSDGLECTVLVRAGSDRYN